MEISDDKKLCEKRLEFAVVNNKNVQKLVDAISSLGCPLPKDFILCRKCPGEISGGFALPPKDPNNDSYKPQIVLCENNKMERETFENTLVHELVHAYDLCRAKIDWSNCLHHACTEIRASSLSGECALLHEIFRGHAQLLQGHRKCVSRRSELSVKMNPVCNINAAEYVKVAFPECYDDKSPFDD